MTGWRRRLVELVRPSRLRRELDEELRAHVEFVTDRYRRAGLSNKEARRRALVDLGSPDATLEVATDTRPGASIGNTARDVRLAARALRRAPGLTVLAVATMAIGIGASTLLFALVNGIVLRPLPYPEPDRLVRVFDRHDASGVTRAGAASGNINDWRARTASFTGLAGYYAMGRTLVAGPGADAQVLLSAQVTDDFFEVLGVAPLLGRPFTSNEFRRADFSNAAMPIGADPVVIISHRLWQQQFGAAADVVGRSTSLERRSFRVVGVMPSGFAMPDPDVDLWLPWNITGTRPRDQHYLGAIARLAPGVSLPAAAADLNAVAVRLGEEFPDTNEGWSVELSPLAVETTGAAASVLWILLGAVGLLLAVACANLALLGLSRGLDRAPETAVRIALGASTGRLVREFFCEAVLLAGSGGIAGLTLAAFGLQGLRLFPDAFPRLDDVRLDWTVMLFAVSVTSASAIVAGIVPAIRRARLGAIGTTPAGSPRTGTPRRHRRLRDTLVVAQVALAIVLVTGAGLLVRTFMHLRTADPGFDPAGVLVAPVFLDTEAYDTGAKVRSYYGELFARLRALPGVTAVGGATAVPTAPLGPNFDRPVWPDGATDEGARMPASVRMVTSGYFDAIGLQVTDGRAIDDRDRPDGPRVVMVSETLARRLWPGTSALGRRLVIDYSTAGTYAHEVVGVVRDVRFGGPRSEPRPELYLSHAQRSYLILNIVIRSTGDARALVGSVRRAMHEIDPEKPAQALTPLEDLVGATYARERQAMLALAAFGLMALGLAVMSLYGVLAQRVRERSRDIGIRMVLGAPRLRLVAWVEAEALRLLGYGLATGLGLAAMFSGSLDSLLFGVQPIDAATLIQSALLLSGVGLAAAGIPAWRATRIDPVTILRRG